MIGWRVHAGFAVILNYMKDDNLNHNLEPVTRGEFKEFVDFVVENVATKEGLKKLDDKIEKLDDKIGSINEEMVAMKDEILTSRDKLIRKLDTNNTERLMIIAGLDRHETRITKLEKHTGLAA